ncbi:MAG: GAF domain-containing protein [Acidobacteria bacterium]|nr:GAF domain-containing protein [Acidobacteriota bacterium]
MFEKRAKKDQKILVVEDSLTQAQKLVGFLEDQGFQCLLARTGADGLTAMRENDPTLVVSDVLMPEMNGYDFCRAAKSDETLKEIPIILLTSLSDTTDILRGLECGADNFITKPYNEDYLLTRIEYILTNRELRKRNRLQMGVEIEFAGKIHFITSERQQILDLLISTYEQAVHINDKLKRREEELETSVLHLATLNAIGNTLNQSLDLDEILEVALEKLIEILLIDGAGIFLREGETLVLKANRELPVELLNPKLVHQFLQSPGMKPGNSGAESAEPVPGAFPWFKIHSIFPSNSQFFMGIPLRAKQEIIGFIVLYMLRSQQFNQAEIEWIQSIGNQIAAATENARLYELMKSKRIQEQAMLFALSQQLLTTMDLDEILAQTAQTARDLVQADLAGIFLADVRGQVLTLASCVGSQCSLFKEFQVSNTDETVFGSVFRTKVPVIVLEVDTEDGTAPPFLAETGFVSAAFIPVISGGDVLGVLMVGTTQIHQFGEGDLRLLALVANQCAAALSNVRLYQSTQDRASKLEQLSHLTADISAQHETYRILQTAVKGLMELLEVPDGGYFAFHPHLQTLTLDVNLSTIGHYPTLVQVEQGLVGRVVETGEAMVIEDYSQWEHRLEPLAQDQVSIMAIPVKFAGTLMGVLFATDKAAAGRFTSNDLHLGRLLGNQVGIALQNSQAERALRESEEKYRLLFEASPQAMWVQDLTTHRFLAVNDTAISRYGYSREEFLTMTMSDLSYPEGAQAGDIPDQSDAPAPSEPHLSGTGKHYTKNGSVIWGDVVSHVIEFSQQPARLIVATDISERKILEEQLRHAQKMESIGTLAGGIAHDFNNILTAIMGFNDLAIRTVPPASPVKNYLREVANAADRASMLTRQLLTFARKQILEAKHFNLNEVISNLEKFLGRVIGEQIELRFLKSDHLWVIHADISQVEQILMNLCINARDAMPNGGVLLIETCNISLDEAYCRFHTFAKPGDYVLLSVRDTGSGMDRATQERIFEPFFTTKEAGKGTGLGLAMVYGIVSQHNGFINVYSELDHGTIFRVYLPAVVTAGEVVTKVVNEEPFSGSGTILLVEDESIVRDLVTAVLEPEGYTVLQAVNGLEAIQLFEHHDGKVDLIISDMVMPGMSGKQLFETLTRRDPNLKFILMTGYSAEAIEGQIEGRVKPGMLHKPFSPLDLFRKIKEVLGTSNG